MKKDSPEGDEREPERPQSAAAWAARVAGDQERLLRTFEPYRDVMRAQLAALQPFEEIVRSQQAILAATKPTRAFLRSFDETAAIARRAAYSQQIASSVARFSVPSVQGVTVPWIDVAQLPQVTFPTIDTSVLTDVLRNYEGIRTAIANFIAAQPRPEEQVRLMRYLSERGWYPSPAQSVSDDRELLRVADEGDHEAVERHMVEFGRERIADIADAVAERWPARRLLVESALSAHLEGRYELSTPVLLAQADGIALDLLGTKLYSTKDGTPRTRAKVFALLGADAGSDWSPTLADMFLAPLIHGSSLMASSTQREDRQRADSTYGGTLNRHEVLHGIALDYGTEANSLRAALVLDYLAWQAGTSRRSRSSPRTRTVVLPRRCRTTPHRPAASDCTFAIPLSHWRATGPRARSGRR